MYKLLKNFTHKGTFNPDKWIISEYPSTTSFLKRLERGKTTPTNQTSSNEGGYDFSQTNNMAEAMKILREGSPDILNGLKDATKHAIADLKKELHTQPDTYICDVEGLFFDVAKVIEGEPECWYRESWDKARKPRIYVPINGTYNAGFDSKKAIKNASKVIALVKALEDKGIEVELDMMFLSSGMTYDGKNGFSSIRVKGYDENFNYAKLSGMLHPAFFRRLNFRESELQAPDDLSGGYGGAMNFKDLFEEGRNMLSIADTDSIENFKKEAVQLLKGKTK
tara:strand:+ start:1020 stop:1859 length:840 start_codon:yes stop_codon:yes gene_type:complete